MARALSKLGFCSRSQGTELVRAGGVTVNGGVQRDPEFPTHIGRDRIEVNGGRIEPAARIYLMLNKPRGVVTTASDEKGRQTVYDLLPHTESWLAPVGRLDKASEGLLLLTNDSEWAARLLLPETHVTKTYHVQIAAHADDALLRSLRQGVRDAGDFLRAKDARLLRSGERHSWLEILLDEGKNRHIRRTLAALGIEVLRLVRVAIGPQALGNLAKGAFRPLSPAEKTAIDRALARRHLSQDS